ncbi:hypothetical protein Q1695_015266 [Nippostrongylus brasiliensis]|nr:hypothetical protein Q1695_015266 [Nippostrongylus brasiliensis]
MMYMWYVSFWIPWSFLAAANLPHCSKTVVMEGKVRRYDATGAEQIESATKFGLNLNNTVCVELTNTSNTLLSFTLEKVEQHYEAKSAYIFAIPLLTTSCFCGCADFVHSCNFVEYNYRRCTSGLLCYRKHYSFQSGDSCDNKKRSEACCEIIFDLFGNATYTAIEVSQPDTIATFRYDIYEQSEEHWRLVSRRHIPLSLNKGSTETTVQRRYDVNVDIFGSRPFRELPPGMYYVPNGSSNVFGHVPINDVYENSLAKLGWFRYADGRWDIRRGDFQARDAHNVYFTDCAAQKYASSFDADNFAYNGTNDNKLVLKNVGRLLSSDQWVSDAIYKEGSIVVQFADGIHIYMNLITKMRPRLIEHHSGFMDIAGSIQMDQYGNQFMNITLYNAKGTLLGKIYANETKSALQYRITIAISGSTPSDYTSRISLPSSINSSRYVCIVPEGNSLAEMCRNFPYYARALQKVATDGPEFVLHNGTCKG